MDPVVISTVCGSGIRGFADGKAADAQFDQPVGVLSTARGLLVADTFNHRVRIVDANGSVRTLSGSHRKGFKDGGSTEARFHNCGALGFDAERGRVIVADTCSHAVRAVDIETGCTETLCGDGEQGYKEGTESRFFYPEGCVVGTGGDVFIADTDNDCIR